MLPSLSSIVNDFQQMMRPIYIGQAVNAGIRDSINPYNLSAVLIFLFLLHLIKKDKLPLNTFCVFFISAYIVSILGLIFGLLDPLLNNYLFTHIIQFANLVIGIFFVWVGLVNLHGWWRLKQNNAFNQLVVKVLLFFSDETVQGKKISWIRRNTLRIGSLAWGVWAALLGSAWGPDKELYWMFRSLVEGNNTSKGFLGIFLYGICQAWIFFFICIVLSVIRRSQKSKALLEKNISLVKIFCAAVFLSVGLGISYLSIK